MADESGRCVVVSVRSYLIFKRVCFLAQQDCSFFRLMLRLGTRAKFPIMRRYALAARSTVCLPYPFWNSLQPGQIVDFSAVSTHPLAAWKNL